MSSSAPIRDVARVTIEFTTPFLCASGESDPILDAVPVRDANGLPTIPGTTIAGVLRHAYARLRGADVAVELFGGAGESGSGSRIWFTWGKVHDRRDRAVDGFRPELALEDDEVLRSAMSPSLRDHVRIDERGVAKNAGKFDESVVVAGHRFTFGMEIHDGASSEMEDLLAMLCAGSLRFGRGAQRALGAFRVVRSQRRRWDLRVAEQRREYLECPVDLGSSWRAPCASDAASIGSAGIVRLRLELQPLEAWSFGGTEPWTTQRVEALRGNGSAKAGEKLPDHAPVRDRRIVWAESAGRLDEPVMYVPGTALKGALRHRTVFHDHVLHGRYAEDDVVPTHGDAATAIFGTEEGDAHAGLLRIDDVWLSLGHLERLLPVMHVGIDRFTGGVRPGVLFEELVIDRGPGFALTIDFIAARWRALPDTTREALRLALRDLCEGRLQVGAGAGRGHGYFGCAQFDAAWLAFHAEVMA